MSKRCELQKEYHREYGNYKGTGKYSDSYVKWLESKILAFDSQRIAELEGLLKTHKGISDGKSIIIKELEKLKGENEKLRKDKAFYSEQWEKQSKETNL